MPIRTPKSKKKYNGNMCVNCFCAYRAHEDYGIVLKCREWRDKIVAETETCDKFAPNVCLENQREDL